MSEDPGDPLLSFLANQPIAVVGASANPEKFGFKVLAMLIETGCRAIPVNPGEERILGIPCSPDLGTLPERW